MRVLIVDDEAMARQRLRRLLSARADVEVVGECEDGIEVGPRVGAGDVDLVMLDVHMAEMSGVEAMGLLPEEGPMVVFVTAHAEHALFAFDAGAVDYVLKPVDPRRLAQALDRALARLDARRNRASSASATSVDRLAVPTRRGLKVINPETIHYALVDGASAVLHTADGTYVTDFRLSALEQRLPPSKFVRTHRRVIVNLEQVVGLDPVGAGVYVAEMADGATVPVSRLAAKRLKERWKV